MTVQEASKIANCSPQFIREMCKRGILGEQYGKGEKRKAYEVSPARLSEWMGVQIEVKK